ncbi:CDK5RAP3-like protein [Camellia sinensis]|uniref:CDK5RAP3-like protein n=1 Tax=Camellia sinensis TaxID=4442 RepID=UPI0010360824|nr:CDK5RAP3-like protein [Camellia sinensis]
MLSDVSLAISSLTNRKTRDQIMILNSKRFLDRLVSTLEEKKHHQVKLKEGLKDLSAKWMELQNSLTSLWPKQPLVSGATIGLEGQVKKSMSNFLTNSYMNMWKTLYMDLGL